MQNVAGPVRTSWPNKGNAVAFDKVAPYMKSVLHAFPAFSLCKPDANGVDDCTAGGSRRWYLLMLHVTEASFSERNRKNF